MNKLLSSLALAGLAGTAFAAGNVDGLSVKAKVDFESEYIFRGKEHSDANAQTKVVGEYALPAADAALYAGVFLMSPISQASNELDTFFGAKTEYEKYLFEAGYTHYSYPNRRSTTEYTGTGGTQMVASNRAHYSDSDELSLGVATSQFKEVFTPSFYIHYNFQLKQTTYEAAARRSFKGEDFGMAGFEVITSAFAGYLNAAQYNGNQRAAGVTRWHNSYAYFGASVDAAYAVSNSTRVGTGVRYAWNTDGNGNDDVRLTGNTSTNFWYGIWAEFKY